MVDMWKRLLLAVGAAVFGLVLFQGWYKHYYTMPVAESFEVNAPELDRRVLIATQGSRFKKAVVNAVVGRLRGLPVYIKVIDVSRLAGVNEANWSAMVLIHTWENWLPQLEAKRFLRRLKAPQKVVVLSTSDEGDEKMDGVDAITVASAMDEVPDSANRIVARLEPLLQQVN